MHCCSSILYIIYFSLKSIANPLRLNYRVTWEAGNPKENLCRAKKTTLGKAVRLENPFPSQSAGNFRDDTRFLNKEEKQKNGHFSKKTVK